MQNKIIFLIFFIFVSSCEYHYRGAIPLEKENYKGPHCLWFDNEKTKEKYCSFESKFPSNDKPHYKKCTTKKEYEEVCILPYERMKKEQK